MKIIIVCEESQTVCKAFRAKGREAYSCDILPCSGGYPDWHLQKDAFKALSWLWDLAIAFPPCTDLAVSGAKHFEQKRKDGRQEKAIRFFFELWKLCEVLENPVGILNGGKYISKHFPELFEEMILAGFPFKPSQIIQPYQFGDPYTKTTCLWIRGLPNLTHTQVVDKGSRDVTKSGKSLPSWYNLPPGPDRAKIRSKTFPGIALAMADQWG